MQEAEACRRDAIALFTLTALGVVVFGVVHLFEYVGDLAIELGFGDGTHEHSHDHLDAVAGMVENAALLWLTGFYFALAIVVPLIAAVGRQRVAARIVLILGALLVIASVGDGLNHALAEGAWHSLATAVVAVGLPGYFGCRSALHWSRTTPAVSAPDPAEIEAA